MSLSFSISFTMSHIWFCTENTCEENMLTHGFYTSPLVTDHLSLSEAQNWDILRVLSLNGASHLKANTSIVSTCWDELTWAPINLSTRHMWQTQNQSFACASNIVFLRFPCARFKAVEWIFSRELLEAFTTREYAVPQHDWKIYCCHLGGWGSSLWELIRLVVCGYC